MRIQVVQIGRIDYREALTYQEKLMSLRQAEVTGDILLLLEHPPVLTIGRRGTADNILVPGEVLQKNGAEVYEVSRGGDVTYHGPGQIVGYPIMNLANYGKDIKNYVWKIEEVFIRLLKNEYGIDASRDEKKYTGVWVGNEKVTAIGIAVKHWITMHGFAFNVNTDLEHFKWINPCGITDRGVTSLQKLLGHPLDFGRVNELVIRYFCEVFELVPETLDKKQLLDMMGEDN